jgi:hypothetical protein
MVLYFYFAMYSCGTLFGYRRVLIAPSTQRIPHLFIII